MKRKIYTQLVDWKNQERRKPLVLKGVRQCGKTYILKEFGQKEFDNLVYVSCDRNESLHAIYSSDFDTARIIRGLSALTGVDIIPGKTLIFLDEVQAFPQALEALKYFCEDAPEYHIVVAGSLLGVALHTGVSFPVGKVQTMRLFPAHPTFRVMRQSCSAYSLSLKYLSSLKPYALRFITFILLFIPSTLAVEI